MSPELLYQLISLHTLHPGICFKAKQQHVCLFFQSHQYHYLTLPLMKRVLMSLLRFVFAHLFIHQVEAAASSAVQQSTACMQVFIHHQQMSDINQLITHRGFLNNKSRRA